MRPEQRIVTQLPLKELWNDDGPIAAERLRELSRARVRELLRAGPVRFVVVDVGSKPEWVAEEQCFAYWNNQVSRHLTDPEHRMNLDAFPSGYGYFASEWSVAGSSPIVVLERCH